jgi:signal transduction histidine kinase
MNSYTRLLAKCEIRDSSTTSRRLDVGAKVAGMEPVDGPTVNETPLVFFAVDHAGIITLFEGTGLEFLDIQPAAHLGRSAFAPDSELYGLADLIRRGLKGESATLSAQIKGQALDFWSSPVRDSHGHVTGMLGVGLDASGRRDLEREVHHQERLAILGQVAGGIAHDFNNFLTTIMLYTRLILSREELPQNLRSAADAIMVESQRASDLIDQILRFSRRSTTRIQPIDLSWLVQSIICMLDTTLPDNIKLVTEFSSESITTFADPTGIQQLLMNLAINARDAMPEGGTLRIGLASHTFLLPSEKPVPGMACGEWICLTVSDTGTGMNSEVLAHLYEPFFTTKGNGGTGLGLAQVHRIVQQHHGCINVQTGMGEGTTFDVYLPGIDPDPASCSPLHAT